MSTMDTNANLNINSNNQSESSKTSRQPQARQLQEFSFRDIVQNLFVIAWPLTKITNQTELNQAELTLPDDADATLAYGFIHPKLGLSFAAFAPARTNDLDIYDELALNKTTHKLMMVPAEGLPPQTAVFDLSHRPDLYGNYADHMLLVDKLSQGNPEQQATRADPWIDYLRNRNHPDTVRVLLVDKTKQLAPEFVLFELLGYADKDNFFGRLLNEPSGEFGVHEGELMVVVRQEEEIGILLLTQQDLTLEESDWRHQNSSL